MTHNHPTGNSFSSADIHFACYNKLNEVRVITPTFESYVMKRKDGESFDKNFWDSTLGPTYQSMNDGVRYEFTEKIQNGTMTIKEAEDQHFNEVWSWVAKDVPEIIYKGD